MFNAVLVELLLLRHFLETSCSVVRICFFRRHFCRWVLSFDRISANEFQWNALNVNSRKSCEITSYNTSFMFKKFSVSFSIDFLSFFLAHAHITLALTCFFFSYHTHIHTHFWLRFKKSSWTFICCMPINACWMFVIYNNSQAREKKNVFKGSE